MSISRANYFEAKCEEINNDIALKHKRNIIYKFYSRIVDIISSIIGLIIGIPIMIFFGILIKLEDKGPIFYKQERLGKDKKIFSVYKLRSMKIDAESIGGAQWASKNDPRVTKVGGFIRKTRIDEIPQLINILKGEMSLIGPRPERPSLTYKFNEDIPGFIDRLSIKPGLTGLAQVNGGYEMTPKEKLEWDLEYIKNRSIAMDIKILIMTIKVVITGDGAR